MKTGVYSVLYAIVSNMAIALCFIPFLFLLWKKMRQVTAYCAIGTYWLLNGFINLIDLDPFSKYINTVFQERLGFFYTLLDTPLVLWAFAYATSGRQRRQLFLIMLLFIAGELGLIGWRGYNFTSSAFIIGTGLLLILVYSIAGLIQYMKNMEHTPFENSMVFVYAALLFAYGSFLIIYIFTHIRGTGFNNGRDSFLLYYISLLLSAAVTSMGLWIYGLRGPDGHHSADSLYSSSSS